MGDAPASQSSVDDFAGRLLPREQVIWSAMPGQGLRFSARDWFLIPFSLLWGGFAVFWEITVFHTRAPGFFRLWGVPFVAVGLYLIAGRFLVDAWLRGRTFYAVTDRRILILRVGPFGSLVALDRDRLPDMRLSEAADGRGTIRFGQPAGQWGRGGFAAWTPSLDPTPQFIAIEGVRSVFDRIQNPAREAA
jgi:hypothetical protein